MHVEVLEMSYRTSTKGYSSSLTKKKTMTIDEDPFPPVASINITSFDLRELMESKKGGGDFLQEKVWSLNIVWFMLIG